MITAEKAEYWMDHYRAYNGLVAGKIPGPGGLGPEIAVIFASATGLPVSNPTISISLFPSGATANGTDSNGNISVAKTFTNSGDDKLYNLTGGGTVNLTTGFWNSLFRVEVNTLQGTRDIVIQHSSFDIATEFTGTPPPPTRPLTPTLSDPDPGDGDGKLILNFTSGSGAVTDEKGFVIERSKNGAPAVVVGSIPSNAATFPNYEFTDYVTYNGAGAGPTLPTDYFFYYVRSYLYGPNTITIRSNPSNIIYPGVTPNLSMVGGLVIDVALSSPMMSIVNPSGIYSVIPNKYTDTLYERTGVTSNIVKIPNPYIKTGFLV